MNYDDRKRLNGLQELRPLSIPHREEPEEEIVEEEDIVEVEELPPVPLSPLIIEFFPDEFETVTNGEIIITAVAIDPDGDNTVLDFEFLAEAGIFSDQTFDIDASGQAVATVIWTAPETIPEDPTEYKIDLVVTDEDGLTGFTGDDPLAQRPSLVIIVRLHCSPPDRPEAPIVTLDDERDLNVRWMAPADNGCDIEDYDLRYRIRVDQGDDPNNWIEYDAGDDNDEWLPVSDNIDGFEITLTGLTDPQDHEVQVRAVNEAGEGEWSPSGYLMYTNPTVMVVADPDVIALSGSNNLPNTSTITATVSDTVDEVDDLTVTFTVFLIAPDGSRTEGTIFGIEVSGTGLIRTFMHPRTNGEYDIDVTVENRGGLSTTETVRIRAIAVPDAPNIPNVTYIDGDSIDVRWDEPNTNFSDISDYDIRYKLVSEVADRYVEWMPDTMDDMNAFLSRQAIITGLGTNAANYEVQVRAHNEAGESQWSNAGSANGPPVITAFTGQIIGDASSTPSVGPITINRSQEISFVVTAHDTDNPPDSLTYDFQVIQVNGADKADDDMNVGSFRDTPVDHIRIYTPPSNRRPVTFKIQASVSDGLEEDGGQTVTTLQNGSPATIDVTVENRLPTVSVSAVETNIHTGGGTDVDGVVTELDGDTLAYLWTVADVNDAANTDNGTFSDNTAINTRYNAPNRIGTFRVTLTVTETLPDGTTNTVSAFVDITVTIQIRPPGKPNLMSVVPTTGIHTGLTVTWGAPSDNGGSDIIDYDIQYKKSTDVDFTSHTYTVTADTPDPIVDMLTGLDENTLYEVMVRARNASTDNGGYSVFSDQLEASTTAQLTVMLTADNTTVNKGDTVNIVADVNLTGVIYNDWTVSPDAGSFETPDSQHIRDWVAPHLSSLYQAEENDEPNAYTITLSVTHLSTNQTVEGSVEITVVNRPPRILSFVAQGITLGDTTPTVAPGTEIPFTVQIVDDDIEGETPAENIDIVWSHDAGSGSDPEESYDMEIYRSAFRWTLPATPGTYTVTVTASDNDYITDSTGTIPATVQRIVQVNVNTPPTISITGPTTGVEANSAHLLTITINDPDNDGTDDEINEEHISFITNEGGGSYLGIATVANQSELDEAVMQSPVRIVKVTAAFDSWLVNDVLHYDGTSWSRIGTNDPTDNTPASLVRVSEGSYLRHWQAPNKKGTAVVEVQYQDYHRSTLLSTVNARASIIINNQSPRLRILPRNAMITTVQSLQLRAVPLDGESQIDPDGDGVTFSWEVEGIGQLQFGDEIIEEGETLSSGTTPQVIYIPPSPPDTPEAPTIEVVTTDATQLKVSWSEPDDNGSAIIDYDLRYKLSTQDDTHYIGVDIDLTDVTITDGTVSYVVEGLRSSHSYDVQVRAENIAGNSDWSPIGTGQTPNAPPTIDSFTTLDADIEINGTTTVNVVASDDDADDLYYEYSIVSDPNDGTYGTIVADPDNEDRATYTAPGEAGEFEIQVQVFDAPADMRDPDVTYPTETLTITVIDKPDAPDAPTVTALANDTTINVPRSRIRVTWTEPDDNNSPITRYEVQYREDGQSIYNSVTLADDFTDTEVTITNLKPNTTYYVQVRARNSSSVDLGIGDWSPEGSAETNDDVPDKPDRPAITVPDGETMQLRADWTSPSDNGAAITDYDIQYRKEIDTTWLDWESTTISTDTFTTITGLDESTRYVIRVRATNSEGDSEWSDPGSGVTGSSNLPPTIDSFDASATVLTVFEHPTLPETALLTVTATDDLTPVLDLTYTFSVPSGHGTIVQDPDIVYTAIYTPPSTPGEYTITVTVSDGDADLDQPSDTIVITAINVPSKPDRPVVDPVPDESTKLIVKWTEPNTNFSPIIDYDVRYKKSTDTNYVEWNASATSYLNTFATIDGLDGNTQYDIQVRASNIAGVSEWSDVTSQSTRNTRPNIISFTATPESIPGNQTSNITVIADDLEDSNLTYTFSLPHETADDDHGNIVQDGDFPNRAVYTSPSVSSVYTIRVVVSDGSLSSQQDLTITVTDASPPQLNAPTVSPHDDPNSLIVRWQVPSGYQGSPLSYNVRYKLSSADSYTIWSDDMGNPISISGLFLIISGLSSNTEYDVQVRAVNSVGTGEWSEDGTGSTIAIQMTIPGTPDPPVVTTNVGYPAGVLLVSWEYPSNRGGSIIVDFDVQYKKSTDDTFINWSHTGADTSTAISGLDQNTSYDVRVRAENATGESNWSSVGTGTTLSSADIMIETPPAPSVYGVLHTDRRRIYIFWENQQTYIEQSLTGVAITSWRVQIRPETSSTWQTLTSSGSSPHLTGTLLANTRYFFRVQGRNSAGFGLWGEGESTTDDPNVFAGRPPGAMSLPTVVETTHESITVSWSEPSDPGEPPLQGYNLDWRVQGSNVPFLNRYIFPPTLRRYVLDGLSAATSYELRMSAESVLGEGPQTNVFIGTTLARPPTTEMPPDKVVIASVTGINSTSLRVLWTEPDNNGSSIVDYDIEYRPTTPADEDWIDFAFFGVPSAAGSLGIDIINLDASTEYEVRVRAVNSAVENMGHGDWSDTVSGTTLATAVVTAPEPPSISSITTPSTNTLRVHWIAPSVDSDPDTDDEITDYDVQYKRADQTDYTDWNVGTSFTGTTTDITGLLPNVEYDVRVQATNSAGSSGYGNSVRARTTFSVPDPPEGLSVSENPDPTKLNVSWQVPNLFGGVVVDYDVQYREAVDEGETENAWQDWPDPDVTNTNPSTIIEGLTADTEYDVRARTQSNSTIDIGNGIGTSNWSTPVEGKTAEQTTLARVPDAPVITSPLPPSPGAEIVSNEDTEIDITWSRPSDNGAAITGYYVQYKLVTSNTWIDLARVSSDLLIRRATITQLTRNTRYNVRVFARNSVGDSPYSPEVTIRTADAVSIPAPSVIVGTITTNSIMVSWIAPSTTETITGYRIEWKLFSDPISNYSAWARQMSGLSETIINLSSNTRYNIRVAAVVGTVIGNWGTVDATTLESNRSPQIDEFFANPTQITTAQTSVVTADASDLDNDPLSYEVDITHFNDTDITSSMEDYGSITQLTDDSQGRKRFRFTPPNRTGTYRLTLTVSDGNVDVTDTLNITVVGISNNAPTVTITAPDQIVENTDSPISAEIQDPDSGDTWEATWSVSPNVGSLSVTTDMGDRTDNIAETVYTAGDIDDATRITITISVEDNRGATVTESKEIDIVSAVTVPAEVTGVSVERVSGSTSELDVSWRKPYDGGAPITEYEIRYVDESDNVNTVTATGEDNLDERLTGLDAGEEYEIQVRARNSQGYGDYSDIVRQSTHSTITVPNQVEGVEVDTVTGSTSQLDVSWSKPDDGGATIIDYQIRYTDEDDTTLTVTVTGEDDLDERLTGLDAGEEYEVQVRARNSQGYGLYSSIVRETTLSTVPDKVTGVSVDRVRGSTTELDVSWSKPGDGGSTITEYEIRYVDEDSTTLTVTATGEDNLDERLTGLTSDHEYDVQVRARNSNGYGEYSDVVTQSTPAPEITVTVPAQVTGVAVNTVTGSTSQLDVSWSKPDDGGATIIDYQIRYTDEDDTTLTVTVTGEDDLDERLTGLDAGEEYEVQVRARNSQGYGLYSSIVRETTLSTVPDKVTGVSVDRVRGSTTELDVSWSKPGDGGSTITEYEIRYVDEDSTTLTVTATGEDNLDERLTGLTSDHEYDVQVRARNSNGYGEYSDVVTQSTPSGNQAPTVQIQINGVSVSSFSADQLQTIRIDAVTTDDSDTTDDLTFSWSRTGGTFTNSADTFRNWRAPGTSGSYTITVTVEDTGGLSASDSVTMVVSNRAPRITSISDGLELCPGNTVNIDVVASDSDAGDTLTYSWSYPGTGVVQLGGRRLRWTAPVTGGDHDITVTVSDPEGLSDSETVTMTVNSLPTVSVSASETTIDRGDTITITAIVTDVDDDYSSLTGTSNNGGGTWTGVTTTTNLGNGRTQVQRNWRAPNVKGDYTITLGWSDDCGRGEDSVTITVRNSSPNPSITPSTSSLVVGQQDQFTVTHGDPDGTSDIASYSWSISGSADGEIQGSGSTITVNYDNGSAGTDTLTCVVTDNDGATGTATATITVTARQLMPPTVSLRIDDSSLNPGQATTVRATITNLSGGTVTWSSTGGTLSGSSNTTRTFTAPNNVVAGTDYTITVEVSNTDGTADDSVTATINNVRPVITSITGVPDTVKVDGTFTPTVNASDNNGDSLSYAWAPIALFDNANLQSPTFEAPSRTGASTALRTFQCRVTDSPPSGYTSLSATRSDSVIVIPNTPTAPTNVRITATSQTRLDFGWAPPSDDGGAPITGYYAELYEGSRRIRTQSLAASRRSTFATGLDPNTTYRFQIRCDNEFTVGGTTYGETSAWEDVSGSTDNVPAPTVSVSAGDTTPDPGQATTITASISNLGSGTVTWTTSGGTLTGSSNTSRTFTAPNNVVAGTSYTVTVTATNAGGSDSDSVTLTINNVAPTVNITGVPSTVRVSGVFRVTANASDGNNDSIDYSWSADRGTFSNSSIRAPSYTAPSTTGASNAEVDIEVDVSDNPPSPYVDLSASDSDSVIVIPNAPDEPLNFELDENTDTQQRYSWEAPTEDGGAPITGYYAELYEGTTRIRTASGGPNARWVRWSNLTPNTTYRCQCRANNKFTISGTEYGEDGTWASDTGTTLTM